VRLPRAPIAVVLACASPLAAPAGASAAKVFQGKTQQGRAVTVRVGDDGLVERVRVRWKAVRCRRGKAFFQDETTFRARFDDSRPEAFADAGRYTVSERGALRSRITIRIDGSRELDAANPAAEAWTGTLRATIVVRRRGRAFDRCTLPSIGWRAELRPAR